MGLKVNTIKIIVSQPGTQKIYDEIEVPRSNRSKIVKVTMKRALAFIENEALRETQVGAVLIIGLEMPREALP